MKKLLLALLPLALLVISASNPLQGAETTAPAGKAVRKALPPAGTLLTLEWDDLIPDSELGKPFEDVLPQHDYLSEGGPAALQSGSAAVRKELDGRQARVPGFIVPLTISADGLVKEFFLVPFFGACIHVPPPAPNQIVFGHSASGFRLKSIYDPHWVTGLLSATTTATRLGTSAYSIEAAAFAPYEQ
jgi:hypothetical protein